MSTGTIAQASIAQTIGWLGQSFTINRKVATAYNALTTTATQSTTTQTVKGVIDDANNSRMARLFAALGSDTDLRGSGKSVIMPASGLTFVPGVGDTVTSNGLNDSIRDVKILYGAEGVILFYRLILENA